MSGLSYETWDDVKREIAKAVDGKGEYFITAQCIKVDTPRRMIFTKEFGDTPIPVFGFEQEVKQYQPTWNVNAVTEFAAAEAGVVPGKFGPGWGNFDTPETQFSHCGYWSDPFGMAHLCGLAREISAGTPVQGAVIATVPAALAPRKTRGLIAVASNTAGSADVEARVDVLTNGNITLVWVGGGSAFNSAQYVFLDSLSWRIGSLEGEINPVVGMTKRISRIVLPSVGDTVLIAREMGTRRLPRCLGTLQSIDYQAGE